MYANSTQEYWTTVDYEIEKMVDHIDIWNENTKSWNITSLNKLNAGEYFR